MTRYLASLETAVQQLCNRWEVFDVLRRVDPRARPSRQHSLL